MDPIMAIIMCIWCIKLILISVIFITLPTSLSNATTATGSVALSMAPNIIPSYQLHPYVNKYLANRQVKIEAKAEKHSKP